MEAFPNPEGAVLPSPARRRVSPARIAAWILTALLGGMFLFSAIAKLFPITGFEWLIRDTGFFNAALTIFSARLLIAFELLLGFCLLFGYRLRSFTIPASAAFVILLSGYLVYRMRVQGAHGNCGCFGDVLQMTPVEALYKNAVLLLLFGVLYALAGTIPVRGRRRAGLLLGLALTAVVFALQPPRSMGQAFPIAPLMKGADSTMARRLASGKHVVAFMSLTCSHCRDAAAKMVAMRKESPGLPFYMVLSGDRRNEADFFEETESGDIPHQFIDDPKYMQEVTGGYVPAIIWIEDGRKVREMSARELKTQTVKNWAVLKK